ncbi:uncharacterized protein LOC103840475 isoform X1 [Brassica rapa]|uniref:Uncharacterized protein n=1 Tax=Brassica campestris TaxID=3711 RepID=M4EU42_BRACM|nr:uncharacterized protein LOC103840475 isoform X1 [Brassica rapa]
MPPGAKKRKALKKKQQQESIGTNTNDKGSNGDNLHGNDEHGSQDARESDSTLSSPGSQGNDEFGVTKDPSAEATSSGFVVKESAKEISDVEIGTDDKNNVVEKPPTSSNENSTETSSINVALQDPCVKEIAPVVDSVSKVVISETSEHAETSTHSHLVKQKSDEKKECQSLEKDNGKVDTLLESADGTSREVETVRESEAPVSSEEKRLLLPGPQAVRTSWLSCCGLFDAMTGSDR